MKRNLITALIIQCCCIAVIAQKFSTKLYFLNKTGEKDTIEVGYDINATSGVDAEFGEVSYSTPLDSMKFKTFILTSGQESPSFLKKQIIGLNAGWIELGAMKIVFPYESLPVTISWDKEMFIDSERNFSLITDWPIGGWFDASGGWNHKKIYLKDSSSVQFNTATNSDELVAMKQFGYTFTNEGNQVPLRTIYLAFASKDNISSLQKINSEISIEVYPNPVKNKMRIYTQIQNSIQSITLISLDGKIKKIIDGNESEIDCSSLEKGIYYIAIKLDKSIVYKRIIKE